MSIYACFSRCDFGSGKHTNEVNIFSVYVCVFDEKWLQSVRNLSLERRHVFALCDLRPYTSLRGYTTIEYRMVSK